ECPRYPYEFGSSMDDVWSKTSVGHPQCAGGLVYGMVRPHELTLWWHKTSLPIEKSSRIISRVPTHKVSAELEDRTVHAIVMLKSKKGTRRSVATPRSAQGIDPEDEQAPQKLIRDHMKARLVGWYRHRAMLFRCGLEVEQTNSCGSNALDCDQPDLVVDASYESTECPSREDGLESSLRALLRSVL
ncbi:hypothetical protein HAX54_024422, partial [Datura stramonium]|nr:hypothetical protein [Datura stramonium]